MSYIQCKKCKHDLDCPLQMFNEVPDDDCSRFKEWDGKTATSPYARDNSKMKDQYCMWWHSKEEPLELIDSLPPEEPEELEVRIYFCHGCNAFFKWIKFEYCSTLEPLIQNKEV